VIFFVLHDLQRPTPQLNPLQSLTTAAFTLLAALNLPAQQVVINEVCASNLESAIDSDGATPDWIELHNTGATPVSLFNWSLSDDAAKPGMWVFPDVTLPANGFLTVFASDKDRGQHLNWDTVINWGDVGAYWASPNAPDSAWRDFLFDDTSWSRGNSPFGKGYSHTATAISSDTIAARYTFSLTQLEIDDLRQVRLDIDYDDGFVAYLNGTEVVRDHVGVQGHNPTWSESATDNHDGVLQWNGAPPNFRVDSFASLLRVGVNVLAIETHNQGSGGMMTLTPFLSLGRSWASAPGSPSSALSFDESGTELHTNFKLSTSGDRVILTDSFGIQQDVMLTGRMYCDQTMGRDATTGGVVRFLEPTQGSANTAEGRPDHTAIVTITPPGAHRAQTTWVALDCVDPTADIWYTLDGTEPTPSGPSAFSYTAPFQVGSSSLTGVIPVRAAAFAQGMWPSRTATESYLFKITEHDMPVWSIVTDPYNMWDSNEGLYSNFMSDMERPFHVEFFEENGQRVFSSDAGAKIHGGATRGYAQKTLALLFRSGYEESNMAWPIFGADQPQKFQRLLLRNSGQDWTQSMMRDGLAHTLMQPADVDVMAYRPSVVYINGEYWGIHNIRERIDKYYTAGHHAADESAVDLLEFAGHDVHEGDNLAWFELMDYISSHSMADPTAYALVSSRLDIDSFCDYMICEIFFNNLDWPHNNVKYWRPRTNDGKWRYFFYDADGGLGNWGATASHDMLGQILGGGHQVTGVFSSLLDSQDFLNRFVNRYSDFMNTNLSADESIPVAREMALKIHPEIVNSQIRWASTFSVWRWNMSDIATFLEQRVAYARQHVSTHFGLPGTWQLECGPMNNKAGFVKLAAVEAHGYFKGTYFLNTPMTLEAVAYPGWEFDRWTDATLPQTASVTFTATGNRQIGAYFNRVPIPGSAVIQEINYNSEIGFDTDDWIELHNPGEIDFDLSGYQLRDDKDSNIFIIPAGTILPAGSQLVFVSNQAMFLAQWPSFPTQRLIGDLGFGLSAKGDTVRLFDPLENLIDIVAFNDKAPWPTEPDGLGPTLELISPWFDNSLAESWQASAAPHGSPGQ